MFASASTRRAPAEESCARRIGLLAHELHLYPELSARQNLEFFAQLYGLSDRAAVDAALERAGLTARAADPVSEFSRGMRQRLALERALLHAPRLVLLDEPFTGLDDSAVSLVSERLRRLAADGAIVVLATHDLDLAEGLVSRVALVRDGRLVADEPAAPGLRARYRSADRALMFLRTALLVLRKDVAIEAKSWEVLTTTVFFAVSACWSFPSRSSRRGSRSRTRRPASCGSRWRFRGRSRSAGRSSANATRKRCARCCSRRRRRPAIYVGKLLGILLVLGIAELLLAPLDRAAVPRGALRAAAAARRRCW